MECNQYVEAHGTLLEGTVAVTGAGKLPCAKLIHAVGPMYQGGNSGEENALYEVVWECMKAANEERMSSIAIPAISTGVFRFPLYLAVKTIVQAVKDFFKEEERCCIR